MIFLTWEILPAQVGNDQTVLRAGRKIVGRVVGDLFVGPADEAVYRAYSRLDGMAKDGTHEECKAWLESYTVEWFDAAMATPQARS